MYKATIIDPITELSVSLEGKTNDNLLAAIAAEVAMQKLHFKWGLSAAVFKSSLYLLLLVVVVARIPDALTIGFILYGLYTVFTPERFNPLKRSWYAMRRAYRWQRELPRHRAADARII